MPFLDRGPAVEQPDDRGAQQGERHEREDAGQRRETVARHQQAADREDRGDREDQPERLGTGTPAAHVPHQDQEAERPQQGPRGAHAEREPLLIGVPPVEGLHHRGGDRRETQQPREHANGGRLHPASFPVIKASLKSS
jgi:hypothetical protein